MRGSAHGPKTPNPPAAPAPTLMSEMSERRLSSIEWRSRGPCFTFIVVPPSVILRDVEYGRIFDTNSDNAS
jgi:hypothetical protein